MRFVVIIAALLYFASTLVTGRNILDDPNDDSNEVVDKSVEDVERAGLDCIKGRKVFVVNATTKVSWYSAYLHCRKAKMELAVIQNAEEYETLVKTIKNDDDISEIASSQDLAVWTSGYYDQELKKFQWMTRLTPMNYTNWLPGRPEGKRFTCVELRRSHQYKMNDRDCTDDNFVACQKEEPTWGPC